MHFENGGKIKDEKCERNESEIGKRFVNKNNISENQTIFETFYANGGVCGFE